MRSATCALIMGLTFLLGNGCIEISQMLAPPPPADDTEVNLGDNANATPDDPPSEDVNSNGDSNAANDANTNSPDNVDTSGLDDVNTTSLDNTDTNGANDTSTNGPDDATTNGSDNAGANDANPNDGGLPPLPDGATLTTTGSGLQYFDFELGGGEIPMVTSTVRVAYTGYLEDGTIFDSNENATFNLSSLIAGFSEGVGTMNVGGRRRLLIPPDLGYGAGGNAGAGIGGEDTIIFDVELLAIEEL